MLEVDLRVPRREFEVAVAFRVAGGERLALFGPSGSGKTTILEAMAGLVPISEGRIALDGRELAAARDGRELAAARDGRELAAARDGRPRATGLPVWAREVALLRQDPGLFPHLSIRENVTYASARRNAAQIDRLVKLLQLEGLLAASPRDVSGGQAQRVALARALAANHRALLLDEPYTGLDAPLRRELTELVRDEARAHEVPAVLVAHELDEAQAFADRLGVLDRGQLLQVGAPGEVVRHPASPRVAELVGYSGFVPLTDDAGCPDGTTLTAAVHPERVRLGAHPAHGPVLRGQALACRPAGAGWEVDVGVLGATLSFRSGDTSVGIGAEVQLTLLDPPLFTPDGNAVARHGEVVGP